ncbi:MAG TPA: glycoside hydrolase family 9 protein [Verrucomicrobiae bacterium]|nr:glycoside hydrolase family 9 protein [Verrucomicrobiae bacterium]
MHEKTTPGIELLKLREGACLRAQMSHCLLAVLFGVALGSQVSGNAADSPRIEENPLDLPRVGDCWLRCLSPTVLELTLVTTKPPDPAPAAKWNFAGDDGSARLPNAGEFQVLVAGAPDPVQAVGFKRRVIYAPLKHRDLRIGNWIYLTLARPIGDSQNVEIKNPDGKLWSASDRFTARFEPLRWSPAIHVNQTGYLPDAPKTAMVGYYLGTLGELDCSEATAAPQPASGPLRVANPTQIASAPAGAAAITALTFRLVQADTGKEVFSGKLTPRPDRGFPFPCYQQVLEADFTKFKTPGNYRLVVPGLGASFKFAVGEDLAAAFARTYALGLYHQRCGTDNALPFTRFTHAPCHAAPAEIPIPESGFKFTWETIASKTADFKDNPRHTAPQLKGESTQLYPFVKHGKLDVSGGHHDAGDYSKYTINSAALIHFLVFAADNFPGAGQLDNLGIPESGDGKSDLLEEVKWEADFLCKMQDDDGGFYFLVYPRDREYESDVPPDRGDPQVVWPKTTSVTAASVAALAQCASSPLFKRQFPEAASSYLKQAKAGWEFLDRAIAAHGQDGAYQKITHYGDEFMHDDELAWAACEMYLATGEPRYQEKLLAWLGPSTETRRWGWWRLYESYGCAMRSYAFAARSGRLKSQQLNPALLDRCENEIIAAAQDQLRRAEDSAYGTSFPEETKRSRSAGWYFSGDAAFDLAVGCQLDFPQLNDPRPRFRAALLSNLNYEAGCNPVNICYVTGLGWQRPREVVDQYEQNSRRLLPPTGIPIGNIQEGFTWLAEFGKELGRLSFPMDGDERNPYPFYDRWGDSFNLCTEFVSVNQARSLAYLAWLMAQTPLKDQPWKSSAGRINVTHETSGSSKTLVAKLEAPGIDLKPARIVWEARDQQPFLGAEFRFPPTHIASQWVEAEAQLPDGRRVFAVTNLSSWR